MQRVHFHDKVWHQRVAVHCLQEGSWQALVEPDTASMHVSTAEQTAASASACRDRPWLPPVRCSDAYCCSQTASR